MFKKKKIEVEMIEYSYSTLFCAMVNEKEKARITAMKKNECELIICDIIHINKKDYCKGYGSLMMEKLLEYTKINNFNHIYGNLSIVDAEHKNRLHHFYEKFGFEITEYEKVQNCYYGRIDKNF